MKNSRLNIEQVPLQAPMSTWGQSTAQDHLSVWMLQVEQRMRNIQKDLDSMMAAQKLETGVIIVKGVVDGSTLMDV